jgi:filamentous hemagglutinin family protein
MAKKREQGRLRLIGVARRTRSALMVSTALQAVVVMVLAAPADAQPAPNAQPMGGVVVGGVAAISQSAANTAINQSSQRAALNWQSFNVGAQQSVTFQQPNAQAIALNTVIGPNPSQIAGRINANGQVVLVNQSGVTFYKGSQVNTAGLMVSAAGTDPAAFMAGGKIAFDRAGNPNAQIINNGNITISGAGLASLVAPAVANAGVINARLGHVVLAGAKTSTLDLYGDKLVSVNVTGAVTQAPDGVDSLVTNTGVIRADGGTVRLTAKAVDGLVTNLVSAGGKIEANTVGSHQGRITIDGVGGSITIDGDLQAAGVAPGTKGGQIGALATGAVTVKSTAVLNASGAAGGGTVAIGTTLRRAAGGPAVVGARMAKTVVVEQGATIAADATGKGDGGRVTVLSTDTTFMSGLITAKGGLTGGDGGFVEVSGTNLGITGLINVGAPAGTLGSILLDPDFLNVVNGLAATGSVDVAFGLGNGTVVASTPPAGTAGAPATISNGVIDAFTGDVLLQATKTLTVAGSINLTTAGQNLVLEAGGTITVNAGISVASTGDVILATGGAGPSTPPTAQASPQISLLGSVSSSTGSVSLLSGTGGIINIGTAGLVSVTTAGKLATLQTDTLTVGTGGQVNAVGGVIEIAPASGLAVTLGGAGGLSLSQATLNALDASTLRVGGATVGGTLTQTATSIAVGGATSLTAIAATLDLQSTGTVTQSAALTGVTTLTGKTGAVTLTTTGNAITNLGSYTASSGNLSIATANALNVTGVVSATAGNIVLQSTGGSSAVALTTAGTLAAVATTGTVSVLADKFSVAGNAAVTGGTFEYALNTGGLLTLGTGGNLVALTGVASTSVRLGAADGTITATGITLASDFDLINGGVARSLNLQATGTVSDGGTASFANVSTLTGTIAGGDLSLTGPSTAIGTVGSFTVSGATAGFTLADTAGSALIVGGPLTAKTVALSADDITVSGAISTGGTAAGSVSLIANVGTISGAGIITTGTLSGSAITTVNLSGTNGIGALGSFSAAGFTLTDATALTVGNTLSAAAISLTATSISITGEVTDGGAGTVALIATTGSITENTGTIVAGTLSGSAATSADLSGNAAATNQITNFDTFTASSGNLTLRDGLALAITNNVSASGTVAVTSGAGLTIAATETVTGAAVNLTGTGITITGVVTDGGSGTVDLVATTGAITEPGTVISGTLSASAGTGIDLSGEGLAANQIANLGSVSTAAGDVTVRDHLGLTIANTMSSAGTVSLTSSGLLTVAAGKSVTGTAVTLTGSGIAISGLVTDGGAGTVDLITNAGSVTETGTIIAGTLLGSVAASAILTGTSAAANQIANLGSFTSATGSITINDGLSLNVIDVVNATAGDVVLRSVGSGNTIAVLTTGALNAASTGTVSVRADAFTLAGAGTITGGVFEYAQDTAGVLNVGAAGAIADLTGIGSSAIRLGEAEGATTANSITLTSDLDLGTRPLDLESNGNIAEGTFALLNVRTLTGVAANTGSVVLTTATNNVAVLGGFTAGGGFTLVDAGDLSIAGILSAAPVVLTATNITIPGSITTGGSATSSVALNATTGTISGTGSITTGTLSGTAVSSIDLAGNNQFGTTGSLTGSAITLNDGVALSINNTVSASGAVSLTSTGLLTVSAGQTVSGSGVTLTGATLAITGLVTSAGTVDLIASAGSISELGAIDAGTLTGSSTASAILTGASVAANNISNLGAFTATGGTIFVDDGVPLNVAGDVSAAAGDIVLRVSGVGSAVDVLTTGTLAAASSGTVSVRADLFSLAGAGTITGGMFEYALDTPALLNVGVGGQIASLAGIGTGAVRLGAAEGAITANGLTLTSNLDLGTARPLDLESNNDISDGGFAVLNVTTLTGIATAGSISLANPNNTVGALGAFTIGTGFTFADSLDLTIGNVLAAAPVSLTAPNITISGTINTGGSTVSSTTLVATAGTISESGSGLIVTGSLSGSAIGAVTLSGANKIGGLDSFTASALTVNDTSALTITNNVSASGAIGLTSSLVLTVGGGNVVTGSAVSLTGSSIALNGEVNGAGIVNLIATTGSITDSGVLIAGTLTGSAFASANLLGTSPTANQVTNLGSFSAAGFTLDDGTALTVIAAGTVNGGPSVTILDTGLLTNLGKISGTSINLTADTLALGGLVTAGTVGTVDLIANLGSISQTGTLIAGTLIGSAAGTVNLSGFSTLANQVGTIGPFTGAGILLNDGTALAVAGTVNGGVGTVALTSSMALSADGAVTAAAIGLTGTSVAINGVVNSPGTVNLTATTGSITDPGTLIAGTLNGTAAVSASILGTNAITTLGSFAVGSGTIALNDGTPLIVTGPVSAPGGISVADSGALTITGTISSAAGNILLGSTAPGGIAINGGSVIAAGDTVSVSAATLAFSGAATVIANTFEFGPGVAGGTVALGGGGFGVADINAAIIRIGKIGGVIVASGIDILGFDAGNHALELDATGAVIQSGALTNVSTLTGIASGFTLTTAGNTIAQLGGGSLIATTGDIRIVDAEGPVLAGLVSGGTVDLSTTGAASAITQAAGETLVATVLTSTSGIVNGLTLDGTANNIGTISGLSAASGLTVVDSTALTVANIVSGGIGNTTLTSPGLIAVTGTLSGASVALTGTSISIASGGKVVDGGAAPDSVALFATTGSISDLGAIGAFTLTGSAVGFANFAGQSAGANQITNLGSFTSVGFTLNDGSALTQTTATTVNAGTGTAAIASLSSLTVNGTVTAAAVSLSGSAVAASNGISINGLVTAGGGGTLTLTTTGGSIAESGTLIAGLLTGSAAQSANLSGAAAGSNQIANLGSFTAIAGSITVRDGMPVAIVDNLSASGLVSVASTGTLTLNAGKSVSGSGVTLSATGLTIGGQASASGTVDLIASAGSISEPGTIDAGTLTGTASAAALLSNPSNLIGAIEGFTAGGNLTVVDASGVVVGGTVASTTGNVILISGSPGGLALNNGSIVASAGTVSISAQTLSFSNGTIVSPVFEYGPGINGVTVLNGGAITLDGGVGAGSFQVGTIRAGRVSGTTDATTININGFNAQSAALELDASGAVTETGALTVSSNLTGTAGSFTLTNPGNAIGQIGGGTLTATAGTIAVVDSTTLTVAGAVEAVAGNVFLQTTGGNALTFAAGGSVVSQPSGTIGIEADRVVNLGAAGATGVVNASATGLFELAPTSSTGETLGAASGLSLTNLTGITAGSLRIGAVTRPGAGSATTTASSIVIGGAFSAGSLPIELDATGAVSQTAPLLNATTLTGTASSYTLTNTGNTIGQVGASGPGGTLTATAGTIAIVDSIGMALAGTIKALAGNVFLQTSAGNALTFAAGGSVVSQTGGTIGLETDNLVNLGTTGATGVANASGTGLFELAPTSANVETLGTASGLSLTNLTGITAGSLRIGAVTRPGGLSATTTASSVLIGGTFSAGNLALDLDATGAVSENAPLLNVATLTGTAGSYSLSSFPNSISQIGATGPGGTLTATTGSIDITQFPGFTLAGVISAAAGNIFLGTGSGTAITFAPGATVASQALGTVVLVTDAVVNLGTTGATGVVNTGGGVFALAPDVAAVTLGAPSAGLSLVNLTGINAATVRIGAPSPPGGTTSTTAPSITVGGTFDAKGLILELEANGVVTQTAPLLNVGTLIGTAFSYTLTNAGNTIGTIGATLNAHGTVAVVDNSALTVAGSISSLSGGIFLSSGTNAMTFGPAANLTILSGGVIGIEANNIVNLGTPGGTSVLNASSTGTVELAPANGQTFTLGLSSGLSLPSVTGITAGTLRIGAVTLPGGVSPTTTASSIVVGGTFNATGLTLDLDATGAVSQTAPLLNVATLTGTASNYTLTNGGNVIGQLGGGTLTATGGTIAIVDNAALVLAGTIKANVGNVFLQTTAGNALTFAVGGSVVSQTGGTIGLQTDHVVNLGTAAATGVVNASATGLLELAPTSATGETLGVASGLSLTNLTGITAGSLRIGAVTRPGGLSATTTASTIVIGGTFNALGLPLELDATGAVSQTAPLLNVSTLTGTAASYTLTNGGNTIGQIGGGTLTANSGTIAIVDNAPLTLAGTVKATTGNVFLQTSAGNALTFAAGGSVVSKIGGTIGIETDNVINLGTTGATGVANASGTGLFELAPTSANVETLGTALGLSLTNLTGITAGSLRIGAVTQPGGGSATTTASSIIIGGAFSAGNLPLELDATGAVTQTASLVNVGTLTGTAASYTLTNSGNAIGQIGAAGAGGTLTATGGTIAIVDNTAVTLAGTIKANGGNVFLQTTAGHALTFAAGGSVVSQVNGTIGIETDSIVNLGVAGATGVVNAGSLGLFELAPTSLIAETLGAPTGLSLTTTTGITAGTLRVGAVTLPGSLSATTNASSIVVAGTFNATGLALDLDATGAVTQSAPLLNVSTLTGTAASYTLTNNANTIGQIGGGTLTATGGTIAIVDNANLTVAGSVTANAGNVFLETTPGNGLTFAPVGFVISQVGGTIGIETDSLTNLGTAGATGVANASSTGLFELAPSTTLATVTLGAPGGLSLTTLTGITAETVRIGAVTLPGGVSPTVTAGSIAVAGTFDAGSIGTLDLEAKGTISQIAGAPIIDLLTLIANTNGAAGDIDLISNANVIANLTNIDVVNGNFIFGDKPSSGTFTVPNGQTIVANNVSITVIGTFDVDGSIGAVGAGGNVLLAAQGPTADFVGPGGQGSQVTANGTVTVTAGRQVDLLAGSISGAAATVTAGGFLIISFATVSAGAISLTGSNILFQGGGTVTDGGAGTVSLIATGGTIIENGTLIAGTLSGSSTGATTLTGLSPTANQVGTLASFSAAGFLLDDSTSLVVSGAVNGGPGATIVDNNLLTVTGTVLGGAVSLMAANIAIPGKVTDGGSGTVSLIATLGTISEPGTLIAGTLSGFSPGATTLNGASATANQVAAISNFTAAGFQMNDGKNLLIGGGLSGGTSIAIVDSGLLSVGGGMAASKVNLTAANIAITGQISDGGAGTVSLIATTGTISETGVLIVGTLSGSSAGATSLTGASVTANQIATLANFSAAGFTMNDGGNLLVAGSIGAGSAFSLTDIGNLTVNAASSITGTTATISDAGAATIAGLILSTGSIAINTGGTLSVPGLVSGASGVSIISGGNMSVVGTISSSGSAVAITDNGALNIAGLVSGQTGVTITDTGITTIGGKITGVAGTVGITDNGTLDVTGTITGQTGVTLSATGDMNLSAFISSPSGTVTIDPGIFTLTNTDTIISGVAIAITDTNVINLGGVLEAPRITINNGSGELNVLNGTQIQVGGERRPNGQLSASQIPTSTNTVDGLFISTGQFIQSGTLFISGNPSLVRIDATAGIAFSTTGGIVAPETWLILGVPTGVKATGNIDVLNLDVVFTGQAGSTTLTGTVGNLSGNAAAGAADASPSTSVSFQINSCPVGSINCVLLTTQGIPAASPLNNFVIGSIFNPTDDDDLLLPLVSDEVY